MFKIILSDTDYDTLTLVFDQEAGSGQNELEFRVDLNGDLVVGVD